LLQALLQVRALRQGQQAWTGSQQRQGWQERPLLALLQAQGWLLLHRHPLPAIAATSLP